MMPLHEIENVTDARLNETLGQLRAGYSALREELYREQDSQKVAALLLRLSDHRADIGVVTAEMQRRHPGPDQLPPVAGPVAASDSGPPPTPIVQAVAAPATASTVTPEPVAAPAPSSIAGPVTAPAVTPEPVAAPAPSSTAGPVTAPAVTPEPVAASESVAAPASAAGPDGARPLTLRFLVEGAEGADVEALLDQLAGQFRARRLKSSSRGGGITVDWFEFEAGLFESEPIGFELLHLRGAVDRSLRRFSRSMVDSVISVIDSTPAGTAAAHPAVGELLDDCASMAAIDRPGLAVFANNADAEDALQADHVAADLLLESSVPVVSTSQKRGFLYGFALATNAAVKRSERRDAAGLARSRPIGFDRLLASMAPHLSLEEAQPRSTAVREPARAVSTGPQAARPSQPTPPVAAVGGPTTYPSTLNGQGDGNGSASGTLSAQPGGQIASSANQPALERRASALRRLISALRPADRPSPGGGGQGPAASDR